MIKVELLCNGWVPPVNLSETLGEPRKTINVNTRLVATIDGTPEQVAAIKEGLSKGYRPEFWVMGVKE